MDPLRAVWKRFANVCGGSYKQESVLFGGALGNHRKLMGKGSQSGDTKPALHPPTP